MNQIPNELKELNIWHCWKLIGVNTKLPVQVNGEPAKSNDPDTWTDYETALEASKRFTGLVLEIVEPYCGVDLDDCINDAGEVRPWAAEILERFADVAYAEISPSKTGIKLITRARKWPSTKCVKVIHDDQQIECYDNRRFWTVTGDVIDDQTEIQDGQDAVDWLCEKYLKIEQRPVPQRTSLPSGSSLRDRARAYVDSVPYNGGGRNNAAFSLAGHLYSMSGDIGERLDVSEVQDLMRYWNSKLGEPLSDKELMTATDSAGRNGTARLEKPPTLRVESKVDLSNFEFSSFIQTPPDNPWKIKSVWDAIESPIPEPEPIIEGLVRRGEVLNVIAGTKMGKSWLSLLMAFCIATGRKFLGRETRQGRVLLLDNELQESTIHNRTRLVAEAAGFEFTGAGFDYVDLRGQSVNVVEICQQLSRFSPGELTAVILDAKYRFFNSGMQENSNDDQTTFHNIVDKLARQLDCLIVLVHHATKGDQSEKNVTDIGSGGGAQSRAVDTHCVIRPHEESEDLAVLDGATRTFPPVKPTTIRWEFPLWRLEESIQPTVKSVKSRGAMAQEQRDEAGLVEMENVFRKEEGSHEESRKLSVHRIHQKMGGGKDRIRRLLRLGVEREKFVEAGQRKARNGSMTDLYSRRLENPFSTTC